MLVLFYTRERKICEEICSRLMRKNHIAVVHTDFKAFMDMVHDLGPKKIDLICVDFRLSEYEFSDPFRTLISQKFIIPFIFYNSPFSTFGDRAAYWAHVNKKKFGDLLPATVSDQMILLLSQLEEIIDAPDILPFISIICPPREYQTREKIAIENFDPESFRRFHKMQDSKYRLFYYFFKNTGKIFSARDLCIYMWNEYNRQKLETLYSYISILRKEFRKESSFFMEIARMGKECYTFKISAPSLRAKDYKTAADFYGYTQNSTRENFNFTPVSKSYMREHQQYAPLDDCEM